MLWALQGRGWIQIVVINITENYFHTTHRHVIQLIMWNIDESTFKHESNPIISELSLSMLGWFMEECNKCWVQFVLLVWFASHSCSIIWLYYIFYWTERYLVSWQEPGKLEERVIWLNLNCNCYKVLYISVKSTFFMKLQKRYEFDSCL